MGTTGRQATRHASGATGFHYWAMWTIADTTRRHRPTGRTERRGQSHASYSAVARACGARVQRTSETRLRLATAGVSSSITPSISSVPPPFEADWPTVLGASYTRSCCLGTGPGRTPLTNEQSRRTAISFVMAAVAPAKGGSRTTPVVRGPQNGAAPSHLVQRPTTRVCWDPPICTDQSNSVECTLAQVSPSSRSTPRRSISKNGRAAGNNSQGRPRVRPPRDDRSAFGGLCDRLSGPPAFCVCPRGHATLVTGRARRTISRRRLNGAARGELGRGRSADAAGHHQYSLPDDLHRFASRRSFTGVAPWG